MANDLDHLPHQFVFIVWYKFRLIQVSLYFFLHNYGFPLPTILYKYYLFSLSFLIYLSVWPQIISEAQGVQKIYKIELIRELEIEYQFNVIWIQHDIWNNKLKTWNSKLTAWKKQQRHVHDLQRFKTLKNRDINMNRFKICRKNLHS